MAQAEHTRTLTWNRRTNEYGESQYYAETGHDDLTIWISKEKRGWLIIIVDGSEWISRDFSKMKANTRWHYLKDAKRVAEDWFFCHHEQKEEEDVPFIHVSLMEQMEELSNHLSLLAQCLRMHQEGREGEANFNASQIVNELYQSGSEVRGLSQDLAWWLK